MSLPSRCALLLVICLACWFHHRGEQFIAANGPTFDEGVHLTAGYAYWTTGGFSINAEDPPLLKLLWAFPALLQHEPPLPMEAAQSHWQLADAWLYGRCESPHAVINSARRINLLFGCGAILLSALWAFRLTGSRLAAAASAAFAASDPTLLALSCVLSTDAGLTFFALSSCYLMWEYKRFPSQMLLYALGVSLGLMVATKFSAVGVIAGLGLAGSFSIARGQVLALPGQVREAGVRSALELAFRLGVIAMCTVAATYAFIHFEQWAMGLKFQLTRGGHGDGVMYLNGVLSRQGWYHYFLEALLLKLPLGLLTAATLGGLLLLTQSSARKDMVWLMVPPLVFLALASYSRINLGVRVVLPVVPFLYISAGTLAGSGSFRALRLSCLLLCLIWSVWAADRASAHELGYFNELVSWRAGEQPPLADSNLDWGQGLPALKCWMDANDIQWIALAYFGTDRPQAHAIRCDELPAYGRVGQFCHDSGPEHGGPFIIAVSTNLLEGLFLNDPGLYAWLRVHRPLTVLDGSIQVFDLTGDFTAIHRVQSLLQR